MLSFIAVCPYFMVATVLTEGMETTRGELLAVSILGRSLQ